MSVVTGTPAGNPSSVATRAGPWDSPAVSHRNLLNDAPHPRARNCKKATGHPRAPAPPPPILPRPTP
ncbi:hypothetical protein Sm713_44990 [Streptomyces sp. TS71-3]|nr:hypothetical protein Sm713_44990 [Streptomyces sp. TS71-3]